MRLSLFDSDDLFGADVNITGGLGAGVSEGRYVDIVGTMDKNALWQGLIPLGNLARDYIKPTFVSRNWNIGSVDLTWDGKRYRFRISAWVRNQHSDAEIRDGARAALLAVSQGIQRAFSNVYVTLERPNSSVGANTGGNTGTNDGGAGSIGGFQIPASLQTIVNPIALSLGVSAGTVLVGGILVTVLLLRRR
jgi:hypothetical protein